MVPLQILRRELQCLELHTASTVARVDDPHERFHYLGAQMDTKSVDDPQRESLAIVVVA